VALAINASLTGHLVLSTLHTNSAAGAIPRLLDMGAEPFLLVSTINLVIAQRLVRRLVGAKTAYTLSKDELKMLGSHVDLDHLLELLRKHQIITVKDNWSTIKFYRPLPGPESGDGFSGRVAIYEVLKPSRATRELILKRATSEEIEVEAKAEGMITMLEDGIMKAAQGLTSIEEVLRVIIE
jgi:type IV pilus assembly protein PilB